MSSLVGAVRRRLLAPSLASVGFAGRGFPVVASPATARLERVPQAVVCGFEWGIDGADPDELERRLDLVEPELRGFAYEGATMAAVIVDAMSVRRRDRTRALLLGPGSPHIFLAHIGIGFALARLPRPLWRKALPDLTGSPYHPTMSWLAVDGYGFDLAYFDTHRWVDRQQVPAPYPWEGASEYFSRVVDQGIGRALWFIHGARASRVAAAVGRFTPARQPDLWSGVGLAATFAGGSSPRGLAELRVAAREHGSELALGSVFAVKARTHAGFVPEHTHAATVEFAGMTVDQAGSLADSTAVRPDAGGEQPAYEVWRQRIRAHFDAGGQQLVS